MGPGSDPRHEKTQPHEAATPALGSGQGNLTPPKPTVNFPLGQVVITPGALEAIPQDEIMAAISRHSRGDWGIVKTEDWKENDLSLSEGFRILSAYETREGTKLWIITEADRSSTCLLLPHEY